MSKVAVIGIDGFTSSDGDHRVVCVPWSRLSKIGNLSDFDDVVVNLTSLRTAPKIDWTAFSTVFNLNTMAEILGHEGRMIFVGDPRTELPQREPSGRASASYSETVLSWTRLGLQWDDREGDSIQLNMEMYEDREAFGRYLTHFKRYKYSLGNLNPDRDAIAEAFRVAPVLNQSRNHRLGIGINGFGSNRFSNEIAGKVTISVDENTGYRTPIGDFKYNTVWSCGPLVFLPEIDLPEGEAFRILLEDACGVKLSADEPSWATTLIAPGQAVVDDELRTIEAEIKEAWDRLELTREERNRVRRPLQLLFGQQTQLEEVVREAFSLLGAEVETPEEANKEDGWITVQVGDQVFQFVLEVKSTVKEAFDEYGLRQLAEWESRGIHLRETKYKPVFVGNASAQLPLDERGNPFGHNFARKAALQGVVALRSEDLYNALVAKAEGVFDQDGFWRDLFQTAGVFVPDL